VRFLRKRMKTKSSDKFKTNTKVKKNLSKLVKKQSVLVSACNTTSPEKFIKDVSSSKMEMLRRGRRKAKPNLKKVSKNEAQTISDSEADFESLPENPILCYFPSYPGARRSVHHSDYISLEPGRYITDVTVDFAFRYEELFRDPEKVWLLSTEFAQILAAGSWWDDERLNLSLSNSKLWQADGAKIVLLPVCFSSHFYGLAAVLDPNQPTLVILESIGGPFAREPPVAQIFREFLAEQKQLLDGGKVEFKTIIPEVPRQEPNSNNCGLFLIAFMRKLVENHTNFIERVNRCDLADWFPALSVAGLRSEIAKLISLLAEEQRRPDGVLAGVGLQVPGIDFSEVR
jgi:Ulp1 family protease